MHTTLRRCRRWLVAGLALAACAYARPSLAIDPSILGPMDPELANAGDVSAVRYRERFMPQLYGERTHAKFAVILLDDGATTRSWSAWALSDNLMQSGAARTDYRGPRFAGGAELARVVRGQSGHSFILDILKQQIRADDLRAGTGLTRGTFSDPKFFGGWQHGRATALAGGATVGANGGWEIIHKSAVNIDLWDRVASEPRPGDLRWMPQQFRAAFDANVLASITNVRPRLADGSIMNSNGRVLDMQGRSPRMRNGPPLTALSMAHRNTLALPLNTQLQRDYVGLRMRVHELRSQGLTVRGARGLGMVPR